MLRLFVHDCYGGRIHDVGVVLELVFGNQSFDSTGSMVLVFASLIFDLLNNVVFTFHVVKISKGRDMKASGLILIFLSRNLLKTTE